MVITIKICIIIIMYKIYIIILIYFSFLGPSESDFGLLCCVCSWLICNISQFSCVGQYSVLSIVGGGGRNVVRMSVYNEQCRRKCSMVSSLSGQ